ncbi:class I SAM-dependent DNA methyltransferase [Deinococcus detaillensis]|uniref:site-specific DNA-methyltransferase (adenine-specific) n=1 Tax=Deinococcus detaillensis TaxID=2592048 RepID=A0A553V601_9DEIO|nr:DNA methyltransferase [Deinococcus detaillensis]TSA87900.1 class I SAM-dependent DNA methyltransferase [Deinococcus detaillensis]
MALSPSAFVSKYQKVTVNEKAAVQTHFNELCELLQVPKPLDYDPTGSEYRFEKHVVKTTGKKGYADVWWAGHFGWEYKGPEANGDLKKAYTQLLTYREDLQNPPLLVVSDMKTIQVHTNFTGTQKEITVYTLEDLLDEGKRQALARIWTDPQTFNPTKRIEIATEAAVADLAKVSEVLRRDEADTEAIADFLVRVMFTLFAEDMELIPSGTFTRLLTEALKHDEDFKPMCEELFEAMKVGKRTLAGRIPYINGGVFENTSAPDLKGSEIRILRDAARRDWRQIDPTIFGTLFELVLDPEKRWQRGAHYTPLSDILDVVEPVIMRPLRAEWDALRLELVPLVQEVEEARRKGGGLFAEGGLGQTQIDEAAGRLRVFQARLASVTVLDAAMGSGNFLYVTLRLLLDLELEVRATIRTLTEQEAEAVPPLVSPRQLLGMEINKYAHEIAGMVLWIGYLQWLREHGEKRRESPVLDRLPGLVCQDAVMDGDRVREWPAAEFIVGNPPFLGNSPMREQLGSDNVDALRKAYGERIPGFSDFVCYWFEKAREQVAAGKTKRVGLIATNSIRGGKNRVVMERIQRDANIFRAWPDRAWTQDGAAVRVSVVMFDDGSDPERVLLHHEGDERNVKTRTEAVRVVASINPDLSIGASLEQAPKLKENAGRAFIGVLPTGTFDLPGEKARSWLTLPNTSGVSNADVIKRFIVGEDITEGSKDRYTIDFTGLTEKQATEYEEPFEYVKTYVKPKRDQNNRKAYRERWWLYAEVRPGMLSKLSGLSRFIATSRVSKFRTFVYLPSDVVPDNALVVIAADDDFTFGVLNSHLHSSWAFRLGTFMGKGNDTRYTPSTTFETFPFPKPNAAQREAIEKAARQLENVRAMLLTKEDPYRKANAETSSAKKLLTLTGAYNLLTTYRTSGSEVIVGVKALARAHDALDKEVAAAYGWAWPLTDDELLEKLLALNLECAALEAEAAVTLAEVETQCKANEKTAKAAAKQAAGKKVDSSAVSQA